MAAMHTTTHGGDNTTNTEPTPLAYGPQDAAQMLGVPVEALMDLVASGALRAVRIGDHTVIARDDLAALLAPDSERECERLVTVPEVSDILRCSLNHAHWLCDTGALAVVRMGRRKAVSVSALNAFIKAGGTHRVVVAEDTPAETATSSTWRRELAERRAQQLLETATDAVAP